MMDNIIKQKSVQNIRNRTTRLERQGDYWTNEEKNELGKLEIHKVFLRFRASFWREIASQIALAELCGVALVIEAMAVSRHISKFEPIERERLLNELLDL